MFKKAERTKLWGRVALYGPSGSGKSYTGLRIATGLARKCGSRIAAIDTEARSLSKYADRFDFDVCDLGERRIEDYLKAIDQCIEAGYKVLLIDSLTHGWKELLEEVDKIAKTRFSGNSWSAWSEGTPKQNKLIKALVEFPGHLIVTMRSKTEWDIGKDDKTGKTKITRAGLSPEQGKGIEYEFDILIDINQAHMAEIQKDRTGKFQDQIIEKPDEKFGEMLYDWLNSGAEPPKDYKQIRKDLMLELKNIMIATSEKGNVFTEDEYNEVKKYLERLEGTDEEKCEAIKILLGQKKEELQKRVVPSLSEELKNIAREKHGGANG